MQRQRRRTATTKETKVSDIARQVDESANSPVEPVEDALSDVIGAIEKAHGKGSIMSLGGQSAVFKDWPVIPSGIISLDRALGIWGWPKGRVIEIYGPEASGKTTLALHAVANAQKQGGYCAFVDAEHAIDPQYAKRLGVDINALLISQPDNGEQALEIADKLITSHKLALVVIDSVAALVPKAEIDGEMGDSQIALQARLMSKALRKLTGVIGKTHTSLIFINQIRHKVGIIFGSPETTSGGNALKFYASIRADVRRIGAIKEGDNITGNRTRIKIVKNKLAPPLKEAEADIIYGHGFSYFGDLVDLASQIGLITRAGAWYAYGKEQIGQGRQQAKKYLETNPVMASEIETQVMECLKKEAGAL